MKKCPFCEAKVANLEEHATSCAGSLIQDLGSHESFRARAMRRKVEGRLTAHSGKWKGVAVAFAAITVICVLALLLIPNKVEQPIAREPVQKSAPQELFALNSGRQDLDVVDRLPEFEMSSYPEPYRLKDSRRFLETLP